MALTLFCRHSDFVAHLMREHAWLKAQIEHERQRAEMAIDELLRIRVQAGPVTQPTPTQPTPHELEVERLLKNPEFATAGDIDG